MRLEEFDYELPAERIAQHPAPERDAARLLLLDRDTGACLDRWFRELPQWLRRGDLLVLNDSRVVPARLFGHRAGTHAFPPPGPRNPARHEFLQGRVEVLLTRQLEPGLWEGLVHPGRKLPIGERLWFGGQPSPAPPPAAAGEAARPPAAPPPQAPELEAEIVGRGQFGERTLRFRRGDGGGFDSRAEFLAVLERLGHVPLPPYIHRAPDQPESVEDRERYQTVFAREPGSAAAPTAGLHFTPAMLARLADAGVESATVTLEVGLGTFQPVRTAEIEQHRMHAERYRISPATAAAIERARGEGRRIVAVGTTVARTLEASALAHQGEVSAGEAETDLFLYPGRPLQVVNALLTNFHAPRSTLLMLVAAFTGRERILAAYRHAIAAQYRFLSYGDCMLIASGIAS